MDKNKTYCLLMSLISLGLGAQTSLAEAPHLGLEYYSPAIYDKETPAGLVQVITIGRRTLEWVDLLQKDIPVLNREQIWRRQDRLGHEASPAAPKIYNETSILNSFNENFGNLPESIKNILSANAPLPAALPQPFALLDLMPVFRKLVDAYSLASRWRALTQWRGDLKKGERDVRPWLNVKANEATIRSQLQNWRRLTQEDRAKLVDSIADSCDFAKMSGDLCKTVGQAIQRSYLGGIVARAMLDDVLKKGREVYEDKFHISQAHRGVAQFIDYTGMKTLKVFINDSVRQWVPWIQAQIDRGFFFDNDLRVSLIPTSQSFQGVVQLLWEPGALPHVNYAGGDQITMDANTQQWLEQTQITMTHEFGHILGFPDCYSEFWDEEINSFVFYTLDPNDRMCALSGTTTLRHKEELLKVYFR